MNKKQASLTERRYLLPFVLITTLFFLWGFARAILDVLNKHFQNELHISISQSALIQVTTYLGYFIMAIFGYRRGVVFGLALFALGAFLFVPGANIGTFEVFLGALFVIGCGLTFLETAANPYVTELGSPQTATSRLNLSQSFNGMGSIFATFSVGLFLFRNDSEGSNVAIPYVVLGVVVLLIALVFSRVQLPEIQSTTEEETSGGGLKNLAELFKQPMFVMGLAALLAYEMAEISINSYFINFVTGQGWMSDKSASIVLTAALAFFMIGRFGGSWVMRRVRAQRVLFVCAVGCVCSMCLVLLNMGVLSLIGLLANYFFEAIMFPTIFSLALTGLGRLTKSASSILMMTPVGGCGFLLMGMIADNSNPVLPFVLPLAGFAVVLAYAWKELRRG